VKKQIAESLGIASCLLVSAFWFLYYKCGIWSVFFWRRNSYRCCFHMRHSHHNIFTQLLD